MPVGAGLWGGMVSGWNTGANSWPSNNPGDWAQRPGGLYVYTGPSYSIPGSGSGGSSYFGFGDLNPFASGPYGVNNPAAAGYSWHMGSREWVPGLMNPDVNPGAGRRAGGIWDFLQPQQPPAQGGGFHYGTDPGYAHASAFSNLYFGNRKAAANPFAYF